MISAALRGQNTSASPPITWTRAGDFRQDLGERILVELRHRAGGIDVAIPGADRFEASGCDFFQSVAGHDELLARILLQLAAKAGKIAPNRLDAVTEKLGGASSDDGRGTGDRGSGHQIRPPGRDPEHHGAAERVADAVGGTRQRLEEGNEVAAQLFQRALGLAQVGFAVTAKVVSVGREIAQSALDIRPAVPVLARPWSMTADGPSPVRV